MENGKIRDSIGVEVLSRVIANVSMFSCVLL